MAGKEKIILVGGGGHCRSCLDVIESTGKFQVAGIVDVKEKTGSVLLGYRIVGSDEDLEKLVKKFKSFLITIGQIKTAQKRKEKFEYLKRQGAEFPVIVSPIAHVSRHAALGEGTIVMHGAVVNANAKIGRNCIINTGAVVEHDVVIGDHCHISTASVVNGECRLGEEVFVGSNAVIANIVSIAGGSVIGAGTVVIDSITESGVYVGSPARKAGAYV